MVIKNKDFYLQHIHKESDRFEMKKVLDKVDIVLKTHRTETTDFLNPHEISLAESILNRFDEIGYFMEGGHSKAEQKIVYIYPVYCGHPPSSLTIFQFESIEGISHPHVLGTLLGLGIDRKKIGDIFVGKKYTYFFVKNEIANFIQFHCNKISKYPVILNSVTQMQEEYMDECIEKKIIVGSLRLDVVVSATFQLSRKKASELIQREKVKLNFDVETKPAKEVEEGDLISVRKLGRIHIVNMLGTTKKNNFILLVKIPK